MIIKNLSLVVFSILLFMGLLLAEHPDPGHEAAIQSTGDPASTQSVGENPEDYKESAEEHDVDLWYQKGLAAGLDISESDMELYRSYFQKVSPQSAVGDSVLRRMIISNRYIEKNCPAMLSENELDQAFQELADNTENVENVSFEEFLTVNRAGLLSRKPENRDFLHAQIHKIRQEELEKASKNEPAHDTADADPYGLWPGEQLQVKGFSDDCLAYLRESGECIITVETFNMYALDARIPRSIDLDSAKLLVIETALNNHYFLEQAQLTKFDKLPEVYREVERKTRQSGFPPGYSLEVSDSLLQVLYSAYFDDLFTASESVTLQMLGSTDSAYIDSLWKIMRDFERDQVSIQGKTKKRRKGTRNLISGLKLPWISRKGIDLPEYLVSPTDTLQLHEYTVPVKTPFGFFILQVSHIASEPEISFDEARQQLYTLYKSGLIYPKRRIEKSEMLNFYQQRKEKFKIPDIHTLKIWLLPNEDHKECLEKAGHSGKHNRHIRNTCMIKAGELERIPKSFKGLPDTLIYSGKLLTQNHLPIEIWEQIQRLFDLNPDKSFFRFHSGYGEVLIKKLGVKKGKGYYPFEQVSGKIRHELQRIPRSFIQLASLKKERFKIEKIIAWKYWRRMLQNSPQPTEEQVKKAILDGTFKPGQIETIQNEEIEELADSYWYQTARAPLVKWLAGVEIDTALFY